MKLISLLIALLIIGLLIKGQLNSSSTAQQDIINDGNIAAPKIPTAPQDVKKFEQDINAFMLDTADQRAKQIDQY